MSANQQGKRPTGPSGPRRYTIKPGEFEDEVLLEDIYAYTVLAHVQTNEEFIESFTNKLDV